MEKEAIRLMRRNGIFNIVEMEKCPVTMMNGTVMPSKPILVADKPNHRLMVYGEFEWDDEYCNLYYSDMDAFVEKMINEMYIVVDTDMTVIRCEVMHNNIMLHEDLLIDMSTLMRDDLSELHPHPPSHGHHPLIDVVNRLFNNK